MNFRKITGIGLIVSGILLFGSSFIGMTTQTNLEMFSYGIISLGFIVSGFVLVSGDEQ